MLRAGVFKPFKVPIDLRSELVERSVTHHRAPAGSWLTSPIPAVSLMPKFLFRCRAVSGAVEPPVACPNLHHVVMRSFGQHRLRPMNGVDERVRLDFLMGLDAVANVKKMAPIHATTAWPLKRKWPFPAEERANVHPKSANWG